MKQVITLLLLVISMQAMAQQRGWQKERKQRARVEQSNRNNQRNYSGTIYGNTILRVDQHYYSENGQYYFAFQNDGNLVIYRAQNNAVLWSSGTNNRNVIKAEFQRDGNLVLTDNSGRPVWDAFRNQYFKTGDVVESTATRRARGSRNALIMQNDGNLVIYSGVGKSVKWAAGSNQ
jgi:hypothetical protein